jgi:hypothetical protein
MEVIDKVRKPLALAESSNPMWHSTRCGNDCGSTPP